jgi:serine/threonine protein kinase
MPITNSELMAITIPKDADRSRSEATLGCSYHAEVIGIRQSLLGSIIVKGSLEELINSGLEWTVMPHSLCRDLCRPAVDQEFSLHGVQYVLAGKLGDGAAGVVRRARRISDNAEFAIKFLAPDPKYIDESVFDDVAARFRREGQRGSQLRHQRLVTIYAYEENADGSAFSDRQPKNPFILMEIIKGRTLEEFIRREAQQAGLGRTDRVFALTAERLAIAAHIAEALQYLHQNGLIHRDVKPANVFLPAGTEQNSQTPAKLGDFGIMKWGDYQASISTGVLTMTAQQGLGTLKYMSPEQAIAPKEVTSKSDIYSFGITLFELFTGQILQSPHHVFEVLNARLSRGTTASRFIQMGYHLSNSDLGIAELILDMHLRGQRGRPPISKILGRLQHEWERHTDERW